MKDVKEWEMLYGNMFVFTISFDRSYYVFWNWFFVSVDTVFDGKEKTEKVSIHQTDWF